jgi:Flp pilus assembly protein TadG
VRKKRNQRGTALVEFALVLPFLAILVFGTIDLGRAYQLQNRLKNGAREGGRQAQISPQQVVANAGTGCGANPDNISYAATHEESAAAANFTVAVTNMTANTPITSPNTLVGGTRVRVKVTAPFQVLTPFISNIVGSPLTLSGTQEVVVQGT